MHGLFQHNDPGEQSFYLVQARGLTTMSLPVVARARRYNPVLLVT
ncbi:hypothetical protein [Salmonella enterica]